MAGLVQFRSQHPVCPELDRQTARPIGDVVGLFARARAAGAKVAVCASAGRSVSEAGLRILGVEADALVCGDDPVSSRPSPEPLWRVCHQVGATSDRAVMVGDTAADIHSGINAKFGEVIGVLSGGGTAASLRAADRVLERVTSRAKFSRST